MGHDTSTTNSDSGSAEAGAPGGIRGVGDGPPPATCALESRGLYRFRPVRAQEVPIVKDVNFTLPRGSFTTIMGPSGSGKSTLLHMLAGLDHSSAGEVWLGQDLMQGGDGASDAPSEERRTALRREHIGFIFQFFNLLPDLTVQENVALPLLVAGERPSRHAERIHHLLEVLGIEGLAGRRPMGLSGGEMQRVSIARALVTEPTLLLADEPTGNLSSKAGEEVIALLGRVREQFNATILLVTHNPRDAAAGERVLFLHDGAMPLDAALTGTVRASDVFRRLEELGI